MYIANSFPPHAATRTCAMPASSWPSGAERWGRDSGASHRWRTASTSAKTRDTMKSTELRRNRLQSVSADERWTPHPVLTNQQTKPTYTESESVLALCYATMPCRLQSPERSCHEF